MRGCRGGARCSTRLWGSSLRARQARLGIALVLPSVGLVALLTVYPLLWVMWLSLTSKSAIAPVARFVGLQNFVTLLSDREFWRAFQTGVIWTVASVALQLLVGVAVALLLHRE